MHPKNLSLVIILFVASIVFLSPPTHAQKGDGALLDSLLSLAPNEPSLQELLDSLGYNINVATDELGWESFCAVPGTNVAMILEEVAGSATSANSGWYNAADSADKTELFTSSNVAGDSSVFTLTGIDSIGFYMTPNLTSYDSWYTQTGYNIDGYDHAQIFPTGNPHEYVIAFEDLKDGGDGDFNDLIIKVRFENATPVLSLPDDMYFNVCYENYVCFDVDASDPNCLGDTITVEMLEGYGDFTPVTGTGSVSFEHCFLPWVTDSTYEFIFKASDNSGAYVIDTFEVVYDINARPTISLPADFDTLLCEYDSICVPVEIDDEDGDNLTVEFIEGDGYFDYVNNEFCFLPAMTEFATYTFVLKVSDSCCAELEGAKPSLVPPPCPEDTISITVHLNFKPELVTVPDIDTVVCEPTEICFPVSASDANEGDNVTITVTPPATYDAQTGLVCLDATTDGSYAIEITATDELCGAQAVDTVNVTLELNDPPELILPNDTSYYFCAEPGEICFDADVNDPDQQDVNTFELIAGPGSIDPQTGEVCFTPSETGDYQFVIRVSDICANEDQDTINIAVDLNSPPVLTLPDDYTAALCETEPICFQATADDPDLPDDELTFIKVSGFGTINSQTGELCFTPLGAGEYDFVIRVRDLCGEVDQDTLTITIELNTPPTIIADPNYTEFFCDPGDSACIQLDATDPDPNETLVFSQISGPDGVLDAETGLFCFELSGAGDYSFQFAVTDHCGKADTADVIVTAVMNEPPEVIVPDDFADIVCVSGDPICFDVTINDADDQDITVEVLPFGTYENGTVCFDAVASQDTTFCLTIRATDICGAQGEATVCIDVHYNLPPLITLAPDTSILVCDAPENFCFGYSVEDPDSPEPTVTISEGIGVVNNGEVCIDVDTVGIYCVTVRATDECGAYHEDQYCVIFKPNQPPVLTVSEDIDTAMCEPAQICFESSATDPDLPNDTLIFSLTDSPQGATLFEDGRVCFTPDGAGAYMFTIRVTDHCGAFDEKTVTVNVDLNQPPTISVSPDSLYHEYCGFGAPALEVCFDGLTIGDPDNAIEDLTVEMIEGPGTFDPLTLTTCFTPPVITDTIEFVYKVTDTCSAFDMDTLLYYVFVNEECDTATCLEVWIENSPCVVTNSSLDLHITADVGIEIGGFDLLIKFDPSAFSFISAFRGDATEEWEYFTYKTGNVGGCQGVCPDGLVRIVAIADRNDGAAHPPADAFDPDGTIAVMRFYVTSDLNFSGLTYPVDFYWMDCADNSFSSKSGDTLFVEKLITNQYGIVWDEFDDDNYPEDSRFQHIGIPDTCLVGDKTKPHRCVIMHNGSICIIHPDSIDARGDLNLNEIPNEIADVVLYTNYFIFGPSVFIINYDGQVAASDVNGDGRTLTVGDLVYLIRVLIGDADPINRTASYVNEVDLTVDNTGSEVAVSTESDVNIGGAGLIFNISGTSMPPEVKQAETINDMTLKWNIDGDLLKVIIYSISTNRIESGQNDLFTIMADGEVELISTDIADYDGNDLRVNTVKKTILPQAYELSQNYPNPFNPETDIQLSLPEASEWRIEIYNLNGRVVKTYSGFSDAGVVKVTFRADGLASGMYFYRAVAGDWSETKKMILLK